jgi:putative transposase
VKAITEELCGHEFSASTVSRLNQTLDERLTEFAERKLEEPYPYLIVDARYEKVRESGVVRSRAVLVAIGVNMDGRRCILGVDLASRESKPTWQEFFVNLKKRGLDGVELVVSDAHEGLRQAVREVFPESLWQRCYVHFLRNALDYMTKRKDTDALTELRWLYDRRNAEEANRDLGTWLQKWQSQHPKLCDWVEATIGETLTFYRFPEPHHKHLRSTNMLERVNEELKRRTHIVRIFPNEASCLRLVRALSVEFHEEWQEGSVYLNMQPLVEQRRRRRIIQEVA